MFNLHKIYSCQGARMFNLHKMYSCQRARMFNLHKMFSWHRARMFNCMQCIYGIGLECLSAYNVFMA